MLAQEHQVHQEHQVQQELMVQRVPLELVLQAHLVELQDLVVVQEHQEQLD